MLKTTCASIIAAAALVTFSPVQAQDYGTSAGMSSQGQTTGTGDQYMRTQENYTRSYEETEIESSSPASEYSFTSDEDVRRGTEGDYRYSRSDPYWGDSEPSRYHAHQEAYVPGSSRDFDWASNSLSDPSREGFVGTPFRWDSNRYLPHPDYN